MFLLHSCGILPVRPSRTATAKHSLGNPLVSKERVPTPNTCQHKSKHKRRMQHAFMHARGHHLNRVPRRHLGSVCEASSTRTRPVRRGKPSTTSQGKRARKQTSEQQASALARATPERCWTVSWSVRRQDVGPHHICLHRKAPPTTKIG